MSFIREQIVKRITRSSGWRKVRSAFIKEHPYCANCGRKHSLEVHHVKDFSTSPELELDPENLITLCSRCHLLVGHLGYWKSINPFVREDCQYFIRKINNRRDVCFKLGENGPHVHVGPGTSWQDPSIIFLPNGNTYELRDIIKIGDETRYGFGWPDMDVEIVHPDTNEVLASGLCIGLSGGVAYTFDPFEFVHYTWFRPHYTKTKKEEFHDTYTKVVKLSNEIAEIGIPDTVIMEDIRI